MIKKFKYFSYKSIKEDLKVSGDGILQEIDQFEGELGKKLNMLGDKAQSFMNWREPDFSEEKIRKYKDVSDAFFNIRPFSKVNTANIIEVSKKMSMLTNVETLMNYFSILLSEEESIINLYEKVKKEAEKVRNDNRNEKLEILTRSYETWVSCIKLLRSTVNSPDFFKKIITDEKELKVSYKKKDGGNTEGEIKSAEIGDNGKITFTITNGNVGDIKKDITEMIPPNKEESEEKKNAQENIGAIQNDLSKMKKIASYADFLNKVGDDVVKKINDMIKDKLNKL